MGPRLKGARRGRTEGRKPGGGGGQRGGVIARDKERRRKEVGEEEEGRTAKRCNRPSVRSLAIEETLQGEVATSAYERAWGEGSSGSKKGLLRDRFERLDMDFRWIDGYGR